MTGDQWDKNVKDFFPVEVQTAGKRKLNFLMRNTNIILTLLTNICHSKSHLHGEVG